MSEICKNWTQWLKQNRFAGQTPEMIEQTTKWLEAVRDVVLVYAEIKPYDVVIDIGTGTGLLAFKALEMQDCKGKVIFSDKFQDCLDDCKRILDESGVVSGYEMLLSPCEHIALPESSVHKALMRSVLVHIVNKQPAINEIYRILKPSGKFCAFEPVIRSNTRYWQILDPMYIEKYEDFKRVENEIMENPLDSLCNFDEDTLKTNLEIAGFSIPEVKVQEVKSNYVVQEGMVAQWFNNPPSPGQPSTKERYMKYFDEATVDKFMADVQNYLTGREISLKSNAVFINATK
ncbi:MAG: methyltransferase domain-containing protein [Cyanobacteria bacterium SIG31]|nr:methyltransferase domain-containing protein [Cyanobacteria bacterium SIG31]